MLTLPWGMGSGIWIDSKPGMYWECLANMGERGNPSGLGLWAPRIVQAHGTWVN